MSTNEQLPTTTVTMTRDQAAQSLPRHRSAQDAAPSKQPPPHPEQDLLRESLSDVGHAEPESQHKSENTTSSTTPPGRNPDANPGSDGNGNVKGRDSDLGSGSEDNDEESESFPPSLPPSTGPFAGASSHSQPGSMPNFNAHARPAYQATPTTTSTTTTTSTSTSSTTTTTTTLTSGAAATRVSATAPSVGGQIYRNPKWQGYRKTTAIPGQKPKHQYNQLRQNGSTYQPKPTFCNPWAPYGRLSRGGALVQSCDDPQCTMCSWGGQYEASGMPSYATLPIQRDGEYC